MEHKWRRYQYKQADCASPVNATLNFAFHTCFYAIPEIPNVSIFDHNIDLTFYHIDRFPEPEGSGRRFFLTSIFEK